MIQLYTSPTPNGYKPLIMLEEVGLAYTIERIDLKQKAQFSADYLAINPNGKIPAIVDQKAGITVFESGAILIYLAETTGQFLPTAGFQRYAVLQWLMVQMSSIGPMFGQLSHFNNYAPVSVPYAIRRYETEVVRLCQILDKRLAANEFIAGDYSIADIATYPWIAMYDYFDITIEQYPHLDRWLSQLAKREAVQKAKANLT